MSSTTPRHESNVQEAKERARLILDETLTSTNIDTPIPFTSPEARTVAGHVSRRPETVARVDPPPPRRSVGNQGVKQQLSKGKQRAKKLNIDGGSGSDSEDDRKDSGNNYDGSSRLMAKRLKTRSAENELIRDQPFRSDPKSDGLTAEEQAMLNRRRVLENAGTRRPTQGRQPRTLDQIMESADRSLRSRRSSLVIDIKDEETKEFLRVLSPRKRMEKVLHEVETGVLAHLRSSHYPLDPSLAKSKYPSLYALYLILRHEISLYAPNHSIYIEQEVCSQGMWRGEINETIRNFRSRFYHYETATDPFNVLSSDRKMDFDIIESYETMNKSSMLEFQEEVRRHREAVHLQDELGQKKRDIVARISSWKPSCTDQDAEAKVLGFINKVCPFETPKDPTDRHTSLVNQYLKALVRNIFSSPENGESLEKILKTYKPGPINTTMVDALVGTDFTDEYLFNWALAVLPGLPLIGLQQSFIENGNGLKTLAMVTFKDGQAMGFEAVPPTLIEKIGWHWSSQAQRYFRYRQTVSGDRLKLYIIKEWMNGELDAV